MLVNFVYFSCHFVDPVVKQEQQRLASGQPVINSPVPMQSSGTPTQPIGSPIPPSSTSPLPNSTPAWNSLGWNGSIQLRIKKRSLLGNFLFVLRWSERYRQKSVTVAILVFLLFGGKGGGGWGSGNGVDEVGGEGREGGCELVLNYTLHYKRGILANFNLWTFFSQIVHAWSAIFAGRILLHGVSRDTILQYYLVL